MENYILKTKLFKYFVGFSVLNRQFHASCTVNANKQSVNSIKKLLGISKKKKFHYRETPTLPNPNTFSKGSTEGKVSGNSRRANVLNKLFMRHITDLMSTGEKSAEILGNGIEINKVQIAPDYKFLKVYWIAKGTKSDETIEEILQRNAGFLRHELSQLRLMGEVPLLKFLKDKSYAQIAEVDSRLKIADFGPEYEPTDVSARLKSELELVVPLETVIKNKIEELENEEEDDTYEEVLPQMAQNVLGLNHAEILSRIQKCTKKPGLKQHDAPEDTWAKFKATQPVNEHPVTYESNREQREAFKDFLLKRQIIKMKSKKSEKNYTPDLEYLRDEMNATQFDHFDDFLNHDEDFIVEEYDEEKNT